MSTEEVWFMRELTVYNTFHNLLTYRAGGETVVVKYCGVF